MSDQTHIDTLANWLVHDCDMLTSSSTELAAKLVAGGIATINRLGKKVQKDCNFLESAGISEDDREEILIALTR